MRTIKAKPITVEAFAPYGSFIKGLEPSGHHMGDFYNDQVVFPVSGVMPLGFSLLIQHKRDRNIVTGAEYHNTTGEGMVFLDDDAVIHVAPASAEPAPQLTEAFIVPKGTMVAIKTGVWHMGAVPLHKEELHMLIILPERVYVNDCTVAEYDEQDYVEIAAE